MNEWIRLMTQRRTIRRYKPEQIAREELDDILQAGLHAPNAGGRQSAILVVCQDEALNDELGRISRLTETLTDVRPGRVSTEQPSIVDDASIRSGFYGAPTVITLFSARDHYNLTGDCFVAAENIVLAAQSLGIGSCIVGRAAKTFATERGREIQRQWGLDESYEARLHVTLGYPEGPAPSYKPRREGRVIYV